MAREHCREGAAFQETTRHGKSLVPVQEISGRGPNVARPHAHHIELERGDRFPRRVAERQPRNGQETAQETIFAEGARPTLDTQ